MKTTFTNKPDAMVYMLKFSHLGREAFRELTKRLLENGNVNKNGETIVIDPHYIPNKNTG